MDCISEIPTMFHLDDLIAESCARWTIEILFICSRRSIQAVDLLRCSRKLALGQWICASRALSALRALHALSALRASACNGESTR